MAEQASDITPIPGGEQEHNMHPQQAYKQHTGSNNRQYNASQMTFYHDHLRTPPSPCSTVPYERDPDHVRRSDLLERIDRKVSVPGSRVALIGVGGVGKTALAVEYSATVRIRSPDTWILWINAKTPPTFEQSVRDLCKRLKIDGHDDKSADSMPLFGRWLRNVKHGKWLLVLDGDDNDTMVTRRAGSHNFKSYIEQIPTCEHGAVLITMRVRSSAETLVHRSSIFEVDKMTAKESSATLEKKLGSDIDSTYQRLAASLGHIPIALSLAASYIRERWPRVSVQSYVEMLEHKSGLVHRLKGAVDYKLLADFSYPSGIMTSAQISLEHLYMVRRTAIDLLTLMSLSRVELVPEVLLRNLETAWRSPTSAISGESTTSEDSADLAYDTYEEDIVALCKFGLVSAVLDTGYLIMPQVLQDTVRAWLQRVDKFGTAHARFLRILRSAVPSIYDYEKRPIYDILWPCLAAVADVKPAEGDAVLDWAEILRDTAEYRWYHGCLPDALSMASASCTALVSTVGKEHRATVDCRLLIARILRATGRLEEAEVLHVEVLEVMKLLYGPQHPSTMRVMEQLALIHQDRGQFEQAEQLQLQVLSWSQEILGFEDVETLYRMKNLALVYRDQKRWQEATSVFRKALTAGERILGPKHPDVLAFRQVLTSLARDQGHLEDAEELLLELVRDWKEVLGPNHTDTLTGMDELASIYRGQKRWEEAQALYTEVIERREVLFGLEDMSRLGSLNGLASTYHGQKRWQEAEALYIEVIERREALLGPEDIGRLESMKDLASVLESQGRLQKAEELFLEVIKIESSILGAGHTATLASMNGLASIYREQERWQEAKALDLRILEMNEQEDHDIDDFDDNRSLISLDSQHESSVLQSDPGYSSASSDSGVSSAIDYFLSEVLQDEELKVLLSRTVNNLEHGRFVRNHQRLLKSYYLELKSKAQGRSQLMASSLLMSRQRRGKISDRLYSSLRSPGMLRELQMRAKTEDTINMVSRMFQMSDAPGHDRNTVKHASSFAERAETGASTIAKHQQEKDLDSSDEEPDEEPFEAIDFAQEDVLSMVGKFMLTADAFDSYKYNVRRFVLPVTPLMFQSLIRKGNLHSVQKALDEDFDLVARGDFAWLIDLVEAGYENQEIAELLVDAELDSPWIYIKPTIEQHRTIVADLHKEDCIHHASTRMQQRETPFPGHQAGLSSPRYMDPEARDEVRRSISEQCGFAGIVPISRTPIEWDGQVVFERLHDSTTALVTYASISTVEGANINLLERLGNIGSRLQSAFGTLQQNEICCNAITIICHNREESADYVLDLVRINVETITTLLGCLERNHSKPAVQLQPLYKAAMEVLCQVSSECLVSDDTEARSDKEVLHCVSLALQVLAIGMLSYTNAHAGMIRPYFLATEVHSIVLMGTAEPEMFSKDSSSHWISVQSAELTCLNGMVKSPVLFFTVCQDPVKVLDGASYDLLATPIDIVDTWGPAVVVADATERDSGDVLCIEIRGGLLSRSQASSSALHWQEMDNESQLSLESAVGFSLDCKERIGAIQINPKCTLQDANRQEDVAKACAEDMHDFGTSRPSWHLKTLQGGLQAGQYAVATFGAEFEKREGITVKARIVEHAQKSFGPTIRDEDLQAAFGLEISLCTGVARRVPLGLLLADIISAYVDSSLSMPPGWTEFGSEMVQALRDQNFKTWLRSLPQLHQDSAIRTVGDLLVHLKETGLDFEGNLVVAWIRPGQIQRCFKLHSSSMNLWTKILEDSDHCATFACMTFSCLETEKIKCQKAAWSHWRNVSEVLTTEICQHHAVTVGKSLSPRKTLVLQEKNKYWIGPTHAGLLASVKLTTFPTLEVSSDFLRNAPEKVRQRMRFMPPRTRLREKGAMNGKTVLVTIRTHSK